MVDVDPPEDTLLTAGGAIGPGVPPAAHHSGRDHPESEGPDEFPPADAAAFVVV